MHVQGGATAAVAAAAWCKDASASGTQCERHCTHAFTKHVFPSLRKPGKRVGPDPGTIPGAELAVAVTGPLLFHIHIEPPLPSSLITLRNAAPSTTWFSLAWLSLRATCAGDVAPR